MKTLIIYESSNIDKEAAFILSNELKCQTKILPVKKIKDTCLLKYDFIILGGSIRRGNIPSSLKKYVKRNMKTLKGKNIALFICCLKEEKALKYLYKIFTKELTNTALITDNFCGEIDTEKEKRENRHILKDIIGNYKKESKQTQQLKIENIKKMAEYINNLNFKD